MKTKVCANIIVVTSTADAGSGSLRQAILDAASNGTGFTDTIRFNIPQPVFNQRIIRLVNPLPPLTSALVIDGTTQPGLAFGNTDAKICIMKDDYADEFTLFDITSAIDIKIYGLYMLYGYWKWEIERGDRSKKLYAVKISNSLNIEIGAPSKGNVINGYHTGIYSSSDSIRNIRIQSNYMGQGSYYPNFADDVDEVVLSVIAGIYMVNAKDVLIGGPTPAEGNVIKADRAIGMNTYHDVDMGFIRIENNIIGKSYDRTRILGGQDMYCPTCANVFIGPDQYLGPTGASGKIQYDVSILNNEIPTSLGLDRLNKPFIIKGNKFDIPPASPLFTSMSAKLTITNCDAGLVGGGPASESNTFRQGSVTGINAIEAYNNVRVTISKNIYECNVLQAMPTVISSAFSEVPTVRINQSGATQVSGTATPLCKIELFYDDDCQACEGKAYIGTTSSDVNGNWSYTGIFTGTVLATATTSLGTTGQFSIPETDVTNVILKHPSCGQNNGSITGLAVLGANGYMWKDRTGNVVSNSLDLLNAGPGQYIFYAKLGNNCIKFGGFFELIENNTRLADTAHKILTNPMCGRNNGSIENIALFMGTNSVIEWQNDRGQIIPGEVNGPFVSLRNLYPGRYRLYLRDTTGGGCSDSSFFYTLTNTFGPVIDTNNVVITPAACGGNNGSITSLELRQLANAPFIQWVDSLNVPVGNSLDLFNRPSGRYRLKFRDASGCDTVYTPFFTIPESGLQIDSSQLLITQSGCTQNNGSIEGLIAPGATGYRWTNTGTGNQVGNTASLFNAAPGTYRLEAFTNNGCTVQSNIYTITSGAAAPIDITGSTVNMASCNQDNASIQINGITNNPAYFTFRWLIDSTTQVGTGLQLTNIAPGRYQCIATDTNGCQKQILATTITRIPQPVINITQLTIRPDTCNRSVGSITGVTVSNAGNGIRYTWYNGAAQTITQQPELKNISAGDYNLIITDNNQCSVNSPSSFTVENISVQLPAPVYNNISIPKGVPLKLEPEKTGKGNYTLYDVSIGGVPLQQNNSGIFDLPPLASDATYFIENQQGDCISPREAIEVKVVDDSKVALPNAFTPNGDGLHDTWGIRVFGIVKLSYLRVFNRWGQVVFETTDINRRWDGTIKGTPLPVGTYYWVLKGTDHLGKPIAEKGPVVIVR